jgi:hypothetical protein
MIMKTRSMIFLSVLLIAGIAVMTGCKKDEETPEFSLVSLMTDQGLDLAGASQAVDVPEDALIEAVFSSDVDAATATAANFMVSTSEGGVQAEYTVDVDGSKVTLIPTSGWDGGTQYSIELSSNISGTNGASYSGNSLSFRTSGIFIPQKENQVLFLSFDNQTAEDEAGEHVVNTVNTLGFSEDRRGTAEAAAYFTGEGNLVEVDYAPDLISSSITVSFWFKTDIADYDGGEGTGLPQTRFVMGLAAEKGYFLEMGRRSNDPASDGFNEIFLKLGTNQINIGNNAAEVPSGTSWDEVNSQKSENYEAGTTSGYSYVIPQLMEDPPNRSYVADAVDGEWVHLVMTVDETTQEKTIYVNGVKWLTHKWIETGADWLFTGLTYKDKANDGSDWPNPIDGALALGNACSQANKATGWCDYETMAANPPETKKFFKGSLDQFRIFSVPLSDEEVSTLYNNEK